MSTCTSSKPRKVKVSLLHSPKYTSILHQAMFHIHKDRDILLSSLLYYCGFIKETPSFFTVVEPHVASRTQLEHFHTTDYLDLIEFAKCVTSNKLSHIYNDSIQSQKHYNNTNNNYELEVHDVCTCACACSLNDDGLHNETKLTNTSCTCSCTDTRNKARHEHSTIHNHDDDCEGTYINLLDKHGLTDDCPIPNNLQSKINLWKYCLSVSGASIHGAYLLRRNLTDVAINFGGGRHHAHSNKAGGFCYVNDVVLAIQSLIEQEKKCHHSEASAKIDNTTEQSKSQRTHDTSTYCSQKNNQKVLYLDLDIHHCDGVQTAFYETKQVYTISLHRYTPGFYPASTGSIHEKGKFQTDGVGYNLNIPMPRLCTNQDFINMVRYIVEKVLLEYDPEYVVLCVGADGLRNDDLVKDTLEGWNLTPEGLAECVRLVTLACSGQEEVMEETEQQYQQEHQQPQPQPQPQQQPQEDQHQQKVNTSSRTKRKRKLLVLGGGGYNAPNTAKTFLLCTAASCEGARPGMLKNQLPKDIPQHTHFHKYGPSFELVSPNDLEGILHHRNDNLEESWIKKHNKIDTVYSNTIQEGVEVINIAHHFLKNRNHSDQVDNSKREFCRLENIEDWGESTTKRKIKNSRRRRKKIMIS
mmetsp:Transcript_16279/g.19882  ORF Transcript_16279/g.19882 Transcript_16279/m.19882 type:complete len:638 (+) Transcript_16279:186-2099(+)